MGAGNKDVQVKKGPVVVDPMAPRWAENHAHTIEKYWGMLPPWLGSILATSAVFIFGATARGEWLHIAAHFFRGLQGEFSERNVTRGPSEPGLLGVHWDDYYMKDWPTYWVWSTAISYIFYFAVGGFLHWYYYIHQRDRAEEWKCQPDKWLPAELERHEIMLGSVSLLLGSTLSATLASYCVNGGPSMIYYDINKYGWLWYFASWPIVFVFQDYLTYWSHRVFHLPFLYRNFHKLHHTYKQPTAFSVTAIHPAEFLFNQCIIISPMFLIPVHFSAYCTILMYLYYHGIIDHSGINFKAYWWQPWQPDCIFHDNHHQYFHVNFAFNIEFWDKLHGTYRQKDKVYREDIFFGKGKNLNDCSKEELKEDLKERESENPLAYRGEMKDEQVNEIKAKLL